MRISNNPSKANLIARTLNSPANLIDWFFWRVCKVSRCELQGQTIVLRKGMFTRDTISAAEIKAWAVHGEMGFDVVRLELENGEKVTWLDKHNDLLNALRQVAAGKESGSTNG